MPRTPLAKTERQAGAQGCATDHAEPPSGRCMHADPHRFACSKPCSETAELCGVSSHLGAATMTARSAFLRKRQDEKS